MATTVTPESAKPYLDKLREESEANLKREYPGLEFGAAKRSSGEIIHPPAPWDTKESKIVEPESPDWVFPEAKPAATTPQEPIGNTYWTDLATQWGATGKSIKAGLRRLVFDEVAGQSELGAAQAQVLPTAVREAQAQGIALTEHPAVVEAAKRLGVRPDTFSRDWPKYANMPDQERQAYIQENQGRAQNALAGAQDAAYESKIAGQMRENYRPQYETMGRWDPRSVAFDAMASAPQMGSAILATVAAGPAGGMAALASTTFPDFYNQGRDAGLDRSSAQAFGLLMAAAEAIPESKVLENFTAPEIKKVLTDSIVKILLHKGVEVGKVEALSEMVTQVLQSAIEKGSIDPKMTLGEAIADTVYAGLVGFTMGFGTGGTAGAVGHFRGKRPAPAPATNVGANLPPSAAPTPPPAAAPAAPPRQAPAPAAAPAAAAKPKAGDVTIWTPPNGMGDPVAVRILDMGPKGEFPTVQFLDANGEDAVTKDGDPRVAQVSLGDLNQSMAAAAKPAPSASPPAATPAGPAPAAAAAPVATTPAPVQTPAPAAAAAPVSASPPVVTTPAPAIQPKQESGSLTPAPSSTPAVPAAAAAPAPETGGAPGKAGLIYSQAKKWLEEEEDGTPSTEAIRKKFSVGYDVANKVMAALEKNGVVTGEKGKRTVPNRLPKYAKPEAPAKTAEVAAAESVVAPSAPAEKQIPTGPISAFREMVKLARSSLMPKKEGAKKIDRRTAGQDVGSLALVLNQAITDAYERGAPDELIKAAKALQRKAQALNDASEDDYLRGRNYTTQDDITSIVSEAEALAEQLAEHADKEKTKAQEKPKIETKKKPKVEAIKEKSKAKEKPAEEKKAEPPKPVEEKKTEAPDAALKAASLFKQITEHFDKESRPFELLRGLDKILGEGWREKLAERTGNLRDDALSYASELAYGKQMSEDTSIDSELGAATQEQGITSDEYVQEGMSVEGKTTDVRKVTVKTKKKREILRSPARASGRAVSAAAQSLQQRIRELVRQDEVLHGVAEQLGFGLSPLGRQRASGNYPSRYSLADVLRGIAADIGNEHRIVARVLNAIAAAAPLATFELVSGVRAAYAGTYDPSTNNIELLTIYPDGSARDAEDIFLTFLHEAVHAATVHSLDLARGPAADRLRARLNDLMEQAEAQARWMYGSGTVSITKERADAGGPFDNEIQRMLYGITDIREFVAEVFSNPDFAAFLATIRPRHNPGKGLSLLQKIGRAIASFLGLNSAEEVSLLDQALEASLEVVRFQADAHELLGFPPSRHLLRSPNRTNRLRGQDRLAQMTSPEIAAAIKGVADISKTGAYDKVRKGWIGTWTNDFIVRQTRRFFDSADSSANPLVEWKHWEDLTRSFANRIREKAEKDVLDIWNKMEKSEGDQVGRVAQLATFYQLHPDQPLASQRQRITRATQKRYDELVEQYNALTDTQRSLYNRIQNYFAWRFREIRKAGVDLATDQYARILGPAQKAVLYNLTTEEDLDLKIGQGKIIDLGDEADNRKFREALRGLIQLTTLKGPYFPLKRYGDKVLNMQREQEFVFDNEDAAKEFQEAIQIMGPDNRAVVREVSPGVWKLKAKVRYLSFHDTLKEAEAAKAELESRGFQGLSITEKLQAAAPPMLSGAMQDLVTEAQRRISAANPAPGSAQEALSQILQTSFMHLMAERAAIAESMLRKNFAGFKETESKRAFAESVQGSAWHYAHLKTSLGKSDALSRLHNFVTKPGIGNVGDRTTPQDVMLARGRVVGEIDRRIRLAAEEYSDPRQGKPSQWLGTLGFLNFLAHPAYAFINSLQNITIGMPVMAGKHGARGVRILGRAMKLVVGPTFKTTLSGLFNKPGEITSYDVHQALMQAIADDPRFGKWTRPAAAGQVSALQQLVDRGTINASFMQELVAVINAQSEFATNAMEWARLVPQGAEMFNRLAAAIAMLEVTNGNVDATADFVDTVHLNYNQENRPRFMRKIGRVRIPQAITMFKMYGVGMYQLIGGLAVDAAYAKTRSRSEAAKTLMYIALPHLFFAGLLGTMFEPLQWLLWLYHRLFGDQGPYDPNQVLRSMLDDGLGIKNQTAKDVLTRGAPNLAGIDLSGNMGLNRLLLPDFASYPTNPSRAEALGWLAEQGLGPWPPTMFSKVDRAEGLFSQGRPVEGLLSLVPIKAVDNLVQTYKLAERGLTTKSGEKVPGGDNFNAVELGARALGFRTTKENRDSDQARYQFKYREWVTDQKRTLSDAWFAAESPKEKAAAVSKIREWNRAHPRSAIDLRGSVRGRDRAAKERSGAVRDPVLREQLED